MATVKELETEIAAIRRLIRTEIADPDTAPERIDALLEEINFAVENLNDIGGEDGYYTRENFQ